MRQYVGSHNACAVSRLIGLLRTAPSNLAFDRSLCARDPQWGLRELTWVDGLAAAKRFARTRRVAMPANNLTLVFRRGIAGKDT